MKITGIIPSRYASTRFPGKPLVDIGGKTMIRRVYEQASKSKILTEVVVATDDERIFKEVKSFGGKVVMTAVTHSNGTERCAELALKSNADIIINIQGDEPFIHPQQIDLLAACFGKKQDTQIATLVKLHPLNEELQNPARIKVVLNKNKEALYFSRNVIPFQKPEEQFTIKGFLTKGASQSKKTKQPKTNSFTFYKHVGIYAYRKDILLEIVKLSPSPLELAESLEQLRWLENGYRIQCAVTTHDSVSIDVPGDLAALKPL